MPFIHRAETRALGGYNSVGGLKVAGGIRSGLEGCTLVAGRGGCSIFSRLIHKHPPTLASLKSHLRYDYL
jgi:hypothetical protein